MDKLTYQENSLLKYKKFIDIRTNKLLGEILREVELWVPTEWQWKKVRSKLLGIGNDYSRDVIFELEQNFELSYVSRQEDIIEVIPRIKREGN